MSLFRLQVNGHSRDVEADPTTSLLHVLRDLLDLTGAKYGCGEGQCGVCTVLLDGRAVRSCVTPLSAVKDRPIVTIEGLAQSGRLHPVQEAFLEVSAFLHPRNDPGSGRAVGAQLRAVGGRDPARNGRAHLPVRGISAHRRGGAAGREERSEPWMS